jgi:hypothetical protein
MTPPQYLYSNYKNIRNSDLILKKAVDEENIKVFETYLNDAQPQTENEVKSRMLIQYLYRKNPTNFCRFLVRSRLSHLILWTEAKCIVRYFGLRGTVYIKWENDKYNCSVHKSAYHNSDNKSDDSQFRRPYKNFNDRRFNDEESGFNRDDNSGGNRRFNRDDNSGGHLRFNRDDNSGGNRRFNRDDPVDNQKENVEVSVENTMINFPPLVESNPE